MKNTHKTLTSVRIHPELWTRFKEVCKEEDFTFQKLAERSIHLFLTDEEFKERLRSQFEIEV